MDPNSTNPASQPVVTQTPSVTPQPTVVAQPTPPSFQPYSPIETPPTGKKTGLLIGLVVAAAVLLVAGLLFVFMMLPGLQSASLAQSFMENITTGKVDKAVEQTGDPTTKDFLTTASKTLKDNKASLSKQKFNRSAESYYLFTLTGGEKKYARVSTEKDGAKRVVMTLVYSAKELALVPGKSASSTASNGADTTADTSACLQKADFYTIENANNGGNGPEKTDYSVQQDMISSYYNRPASFLPDSLNFDTQNDYAGYNATVMVQSYADFYKTHSAKKFTFKLEGVVATTAQADLAFATQRAEKIKAMLVSDGVPAERIEILKPENISTFSAGAWAGSENDPIAKRLARSVTLYIIPDANCASGSAASSDTGR